MIRIVQICILFILIFSSCSQDHSDNIPTEKVNFTIYYTRNFLNMDFLENTFLEFSNDSNCRIKSRSFSDSWNLLQYYHTQRDSSETVNLFLGIDNFILPEFEELGLIQSYDFDTSNFLENTLNGGKSFFPIAYSYLGFIYNAEFLDDPPLTFGAMQDGIWKDRIILFDPRMNSLGRGLLLWSLAAFGENGYGHFWRSIKNNVFSSSTDFDEAYSLFLAKEAPLVLALSTTLCYHAIHNSINTYRSIIPSEGGFLYLWGAVVVEESGNSESLSLFLEYLHSVNFQTKIPLNLWMYPVRKDIPLPEIYSICPRPAKDISNNLPFRNNNFNTKRWLNKWKRIMLK